MSDTLYVGQLQNTEIGDVRLKKVTEYSSLHGDDAIIEALIRHVSEFSNKMTNVYDYGTLCYEIANNPLIIPLNSQYSDVLLRNPASGGIFIVNTLYIDINSDRANFAFIPNEKLAVLMQRNTTTVDVLLISHEAAQAILRKQKNQYTPQVTQIQSVRHTSGGSTDASANTIMIFIIACVLMVLPAVSWIGWLLHLYNIITLLRQRTIGGFLSLGCLCGWCCIALLCGIGVGIAAMVIYIPRWY